MKNILFIINKKKMETSSKNRFNLPQINVNVSCPNCAELEKEINVLKVENITLKEEIITLNNKVEKLEKENVLLKEEVKTLKEENILLKEENTSLKKTVKILTNRLDEIDNLSKLRQISIDLMDNYINMFSNKFEIEMDSSEIYNIRKSIDRNVLLSFDDLYFENKYTFYQFSNALKNMKRFNKIAHPEYNIDEISMLLESYINNNKYKEIINFVVEKFL